MKKFKLLIIDDETMMGGATDRKPYYENTFSKSFDLMFIQDYVDESNGYLLKENIIHSIKDIDAHVAIVDVRLDNWGMIDCSDVLDRISSKFPVVLTSTSWNLESYSQIESYRQRTHVADFINFSFIAEENNHINDELNYKLRSVVYDFWKFSKHARVRNNTFRILHLSDLQLGDPNSDDSSEMSSVALGDFLKSKKLIPNAIVISGDVAYSGKPSEYQEAQEYIKSIGRQFGQSESMYKDSIIIVPGNHDNNCDFYSIVDVEFDYMNNEFKKREQEVSVDYSKFKQVPFCNMAFELTEDERYLANHNGLNFMINKFVPFNIRFAVINTCSKANERNPQNYTLDKSNLKNLVSDRSTRAFANDDMFTILVGHHPPHRMLDKVEKNISLNPERNSIMNSSEYSTDFLSIVNTFNADMYMCGHEHDNIFFKLNERNKNNPDLTVSLASSFRLVDQKLSDEYSGVQSRGFNIIELELDNNKVKNVVTRTFELDYISGIREIKGN